MDFGPLATHLLSIRAKTRIACRVESINNTNKNDNNEKKWRKENYEIHGSMMGPHTTPNAPQKIEIETKPM